MLLCPECRSVVNDKSSCNVCSWEFSCLSDIPSYFKKNLSPTLKSYVENYDTISDDDLNESILARGYLLHMAKKLIPYLPTSKSIRICDIGGGQGNFAKLIKSEGYENISIVDIAQPYLKLLKSDFQCYLADAENLPFKEHFDVITSTDVLEHVINVGSYLYSVNQALVDNGKFIVRVPFYENLMYYSPHLGCPYDFVHLRTFSKKLLTKQLKEAGFKIERVFKEGYWPYAVKSIWKFSIMPRIITRLAKPFLHSQGFIDDSTFISRLFCTIFLAPLEIGCVARKVNTIEST